MAQKVASSGMVNWPNTMIFERALRDAIPEHCDARALVVNGMAGRAWNTGRLGPRVAAKLRVEESGKLGGAFDVWLDLDADSARNLSDVLRALADEAEKKAPEPLR